MITPASSLVTASSALPVGTRLSEFEITGVVGEGGFGIVYSAHDSSLDRIVAVKEYLPSAFSIRTADGIVQLKSEAHRKTFEAGLSSFINEAKMLAKFAHPGLVEVFRFWEANGTAYMAMRYYRGLTLREFLRTNPQRVTEQWLCETLDPILLALAELHSEKCYHRDIAPDNILVLPNGRSVLMDFGAARRIISDMTQALTVVLKPGYAPIEQYYDDGSMPQGAWTDIYAVGGLLYHLMTGKVPVQAISRMMSDPLKPVAELARGSFSAQLCTVVTKCMGVLPNDRYQTVDELRAALGWVTTPGVSTVIHSALAAKPVVDDSETTVTLKAPPTVAQARPGDMATARKGAGELLASASAPAFDPLATVTQKAPIASPRVTENVPREAPTSPQDRDIAAVAAPKSKIVPMAGMAVVATLMLGVSLFFYNNAHQRGETASAPPPPEPVATVAAAAVTPVPGSGGEAPSQGGPAPVAASVALVSSSPAPVATNIATAPVVTTGWVRFELKNGWGTVFVDGENKGTAPPVILVELSPGIHRIELRNPTLPTIQRTVEVVPGKTAVVRHAFAK